MEVEPKMRKIIYIILFINCFVFQSLITNSTILLNAQPGWSDDQRLVFLPGGGWDPRAACCGDTIHLVWWQMYPVYDEVFYKRSTDCGLTWGDDVLLTIEDYNYSVSPHIAVDGDLVHVVWKQEDVGICYRKSTDSGNSWCPIDTVPNGGSYDPWIAVRENKVYVVAIRHDGKIMFTKSTDWGNSWLPSDSIGHGSCFPRIKSIDGILILSYSELNTILAAHEVMFRISLDDGITWSDSFIVSDFDSVESQWPAMDADTTGGVYICWFDGKYTPYSWTGDIFCRTSRDSGNTWEEIDSLTVMHRAVASDILAEGNNLHLVWEDDRHDFGDNFEIYYRISKDLGLTWEPEIRLTNALFHSYQPSLVCGGGYLHLFWQDRREYGNNGSSAPIYYKRKDLSHSITESNKSDFVTNLRFEIYPNPFCQTLDIRLWTLVENSEIKIFDILGKEVISYELKDKGKGIRVDTRHLPCGVYFVQIEANGESGIKKVVKVE